MVVRVVLAVLLSVALLSVALPTADTARSQRAATLAADDAGKVATAAERLARRNDAVPPSQGGATRLLAVRVATGAAIRVRNGTLAWVHGGRRHRVDVTVRLVGSLSLGPGRHRVRLSLYRRGGGVVVAVRRFKAESAATAARVRRSLRPRGVSL